MTDKTRKPEPIRRWEDEGGAVDTDRSRSQQDSNVERNEIDPQYRCRACGRGYDVAHIPKNTAIYWDCYSPTCEARVGTSWDFKVGGGVT